MKPYPGADSVLCLDNCRIHHAEELKLRRMCAKEGAHLIFLAPYCPIDNPIEPGKSCWRRNSTPTRISSRLSRRQSIGAWLSATTTARTQARPRLTAPNTPTPNTATPCPTRSTRSRLSTSGTRAAA
mmetsp:Transcript_10756/g.25683  ORF Transcript_10756/g.25683 Transcript_10756/m.25683 type:complete len:127 (-) Transcript_10756:66-446(-)